MNLDIVDMIEIFNLEVTVRIILEAADEVIEN
jgi:hypothetical protein